MQITRHSIISGKKRTWSMDITDQQLEKWRGGMLIQDAMPNLSDDEREFFLSGITPEEWEANIGVEEWIYMIRNEKN